MWETWDLISRKLQLELGKQNIALLGQSQCSSEEGWLWQRNGSIQAWTMVMDAQGRTKVCRGKGGDHLGEH